MKTLICCLLILLSVSGLAGCGIVGAFYGAIIHPLLPPVTVQAEHDMSNKQVLVWVDYVPFEEQSHLLCRALSQQLRQKLLDNQAAQSVIDYTRIARFKQEHPAFAQMTIRQLGESFAVDEVLYLLVDEFKLQHEAGAGFYQTNLRGYSKVIDIATGNRLWPEGQANKPFAIEGKFSQGQGRNFEDRLVRDFCLQVAESIAPSFYKHTRPR